MKFNKESKYYAAGVALIGVVIGVALVSVGTATFHAFGTTSFCGKFCHTMDGSYAAYKKGQHGMTHSGYTVSCSDCHLKWASEHEISQSQVVGMIMHKATSGINSLVGQIAGHYATPEKWEDEREDKAEAVSLWMASTGFSNCRGCHNLNAMKSNPAKPQAAEMHKLLAKDPKTNCLACHPEAGHKYED